MFIISHSGYCRCMLISYNALLNVQWIYVNCEGIFVVLKQFYHTQVVGNKKWHIILLGPTFF